MGPSCDIYSLGVILYELLTRKQPFVGDALSIVTQVLTETPRPPAAHRPDVDPRLEAICLKAMAKQPEARYASMAEFAAALAGYLEATAGGGSTELPLAATPPEPAAPPARPRGGWGWLALGGAVAALALAGVGYVALKKETPPTEPGPTVQPRPGDSAAPKDLEKPAPAPVPLDTKAPPKPSTAVPELAAAKPLFTSNFAAGKDWMPKKAEGLETGFREGRYYLRSTAQGAYGVQVPYAEPLESFACEVVAQFHPRMGGGRHYWGVGLMNAKQPDRASRPGLRVRLMRNGELSVVQLPAEKVVSGSAKPSAFKGGDAPNTLLVVVRDRTLDAYVNGVAALGPVTVPAEVLPVRLAVFIQGAKGTEVEYQRVKVWSGKDLPPSSRGSAGK
jgi:hypothetical protein